MMQTAAKRLAPILSFSTSADIAVPNRMDVSRNAAMTATGAFVMAHSAKL
jgi:hypothetical protein